MFSHFFLIVYEILLKSFNILATFSTRRKKEIHHFLKQFNDKYEIIITIRLLRFVYLICKWLFKDHFNYPSVVLCRMVRESHSLYDYINIFVIVSYA